MSKGWITALFAIVTISVVCWAPCVNATALDDYIALSDPNFGMFLFAAGFACAFFNFS
jgi:hypothetical protein